MSYGQSQKLPKSEIMPIVNSRFSPPATPWPRRPSSSQPYRLYIIPRISWSSAYDPDEHNRAAAVFSFLLLAGFVILPGIFTSGRNPDQLQTTNYINKAVKNVPLIVLGAFCSFLRALGMCRVGLGWKRYDWFVIYRILM